MPQALAEKIGSIAAGALAKTTLNNNIFFDQDPEKAKKFVSDMGFELELVPMGRYMPETIVAYKQLPENLRTQLRKALDSESRFTASSPRSEGIAATNSSIVLIFGIG